MGGSSTRPRGPGRPAEPIQRSEIIAAALEAFARSGYAGTSMSQVAGRVGLSKASLFHHFPTKESLYLAVVEQIVGDLGRLVAEAGLDQGDFVDRLDRLSEVVVATLGTHPLAARLLVREAVSGGRALEREGRAGVHATLEMTASFLQAGMEAGVFRRQDPRQLAVSIIGIHLLFFAAAELVGPFAGGEPFTPAWLDARRAAVREQVRALCLKPGVI